MKENYDVYQMSQYEKLLLSIMSGMKDKSILLRTCGPSLTAWVSSAA